MTGFVILNYNSWKLTSELVRKLEDYDNIDIIIVVDNMSTDTSYENLINLKSNKTEVVQTNKNGGYSYGNNVGAKICKDKGVDKIFICNPDVLISHKDLEKIICEFDKNKQYSVLSGVEYNNKNEISQPPIWKLNTYWDDVLDCSFFVRKFRRNYNYMPVNDKVTIQDVDIVKGSFFGIRADVFFDIGGLDEEVFLFCEERILSKKLQKKGYKLGVVTSAKYNHNHSESINKVYKKKTVQMKMLYKSRYYYNVKYNKIGRFKKIILKVAMSVSLLEFMLRDTITKGDSICNKKREE